MIGNICVVISILHETEKKEKKKGQYADEAGKEKKAIEPIEWNLFIQKSNVFFTILQKWVHKKIIKEMNKNRFASIECNVTIELWSYLKIEHKKRH